MNLNATQLLRPTFGNTRLLDHRAGSNRGLSTSAAVRKSRTKLGIRYRGTTVKPMTVHQEFRVLKLILNVGVKQKRLASNPCSAVEFPISVKNSTQKPH
jgi:hypothetical protein